MSENPQVHAMQPVDDKEEDIKKNWRFICYLLAQTFDNHPDTLVEHLHIKSFLSLSCHPIQVLSKISLKNKKLWQIFLWNTLIIIRKQQQQQQKLMDLQIHLDTFSCKKLYLHILYTNYLSGPLG